MDQVPPLQAQPTPVGFTRPVTVVVADAMVLIRMSCRLALASATTALAKEAAATGRARIYITAEVEEEVVQQMHKAAKSVTEAAALDAWYTQLAPSIQVVDLPFGDVLHPAIRRIVDIDADDALTGGLALLLGPARVWSEDRSLTSTGFASRLGWKETGEALLEVAMTEAAWAAGLGLTGQAGHGLVQLMMTIARYAARGSRQAVTTGVIAGTALLWLVGPDGRRWPRTKAAFARYGRHIGAFVEELLKRWTDAETQLYRVQPVGHDGLVEGAARLLARAPGPMKASALRDAIRRNRRPGLTDREITAAAIERALAIHPAFYRVSGSRWSLGRQVRPPAS
jgi:hypothetical protein